MSTCKEQMRSESLSHALYQTIPVLFAYFPLGVVFGVVFVNEGYSWWLAPLMSAVVYGGAVQFLALTMLAMHAPLLTVVVASFFVAFRNSFYGLSLVERFKHVVWWQKALLIFGLVDAVYAILVANPKEDTRFCLVVTIVIYFYWLGGSIVGAYFAKLLPDINGLDFVLPAFFMILALELYFKERNIAGFIVPVMTALLAYAIAPGQYLVLAISLCAIYLFIKAKGEVNG